MNSDLKSLFSLSDELDEKIVSKLMTAIKHGASKDFDYLKFKHSYLSLIQMGMEDNLAPKSAFVTAKTMGVTKESILTSIDHYVRILSKEKELFIAALRNQVSNHLDGPGSKMEELKQRMESNKSKIEQLVKENNIIAVEIEKLLQTQQENREKIQATKDKFDQTYDAILQEMHSDHKLYETIL
ncbi:MAG: hypothetical protein R2774_10235 [Saprospiraceae bacterium]